jgi:hypothetical protein
VGLEQVIEMDKVETNVDIPADKFDVPEDVKELARKQATQPADTGK